MLRSAVVSSRLPQRPFILSYRAQALRSFSGTPKRFAPLKADDVGKGSEGAHPRDELAPPSVAHSKNATSKASSASVSEDLKLPHMTGDWVLFHPVYTSQETAAVKVLNRDPQNISDRVAGLCVRLLRFGFDLLSGYRHKEMPQNHTMSLEQLRKDGYVMTPEKWLLRIVFLETVAGVPGFVAATLRHLRSLRLMRRDAGWIHTLLEESENERMHLMTFMTLKKPSIWFRGLVLGAQGVFYNAFFLGYLISPRTAHRFVGGLEEEAVLTYTRLIEDMENGRLPEWENMPAPSIAIDYWRLPEDAKLIDVIKVVRADEATHRFVNHSLANLNQTQDVNPFAIREPDMLLKGTKIGLERAEAAEFVKETRTIMEDQPSLGLGKDGAPLEKKDL